MLTRLLSISLVATFCAAGLAHAQTPRAISLANSAPISEAIKIDDAPAKARLAAVRFLANIETRDYAASEAGLIAALRSDSSEAVRHEAAVTLGTWTSGSRRVLHALHAAASGSQIDGHPEEASTRVRHAARTTLNRLLSAGLPTMTIDVLPTAPAPRKVEQPVIIPAAHVEPKALPPVLVATPDERERAANVSAPVKQAPAAKAPNSLWGWLTPFRHPSSQDSIDRHMRGLAPLGSQPMLSIPTATK